MKGALVTARQWMPRRGGKPVAVILSLAKYRELLEKAEDLEALRSLETIRQEPLELRRIGTKDSSEPLDELSTRFKSLLESMQTPEARKAMDAAFNASPEALGQAAVTAARRRS